MSWAMEALGLPADADARAIKRAYAARLKATRPDDDPVAFQQLHETYQAALAWLEATPWLTAAATTANIDAGTSMAKQQAVSINEEARISRHRVHAEFVRQPLLEAELSQWQDDAYVQEVATRILSATYSMPAADFSAWLRALPELWSLELRPRIGYDIANRIAHDGVTLSDAFFDALIDSFSDDQDSDLRYTLWTGRVMAIVLGKSPDFFTQWMTQRVTALPDDERATLGTYVLRAFRQRQASLPLEAIDTLSKTLCWSQLDHEREDRAWLHDARKSAQVQERSRRRLAALAPGGDAAVLAQELEAAHWQGMTPQWAEALKARVVGPPSRWDCFLSALLPMRPIWMYRFCGIVNQWFPHGLPEALQPRHVRFWRQLGDPRRPHGWQLAVDLGRGLVVAAFLATGAALMLPIAGIAAASWIFGALGVSLAIWSALVLVQMAARWQARTMTSSKGKRMAHRWALPTASIVILAGMRSGAWGAACSAALAYIAIFRLTGRMEADSRSALMPMLTFVGLGTPILLVSQAGAWPGTIFALLLWVVSLIQDAQHRRLHGHQ
ncbi:J domain-containing protein [Xanthomonas campestris]|uniref:J domain-containing protein n=1 Tax=Xanthomonas campestris TaxID=339 RepID=UPI001E35D269|nr:J domain-containing protein [Xanthomonas campestris]MCC5068915.1 J domain-containing protein [Xanthomonas campestris]